MADFQVSFAGVKNLQHAFFVFQLIVVLSGKCSLKAMPLIEATSRMCSSKKIFCKYTKTAGTRSCRTVILIDNFIEITLQLHNCIEIRPLQRRSMYLKRTCILMNTYKKVNCWKKKCNCREILRIKFIFSKVAGLQLETLLKNELLHRYFPGTFLPFVDSLWTFCVIPIWKTQHPKQLLVQLILEFQKQPTK